MQFSLKNLFVGITLACLYFTAISLFGIQLCMAVSGAVLLVGLSALIGGGWLGEKLNSPGLGAIMGTIFGVLCLLSLTGC